MTANRDLGGSQDRIYKKDFTLFIDVTDNRNVKAKQVIDVVEGLCGVGSLFAVVPKAGNGFEITLDGKASAQILLDGVEVSGVKCDVTEIVKSYTVVSFLHLPSYIEDDKLVEKLSQLNVEVVSPIKRRFYPGTKIADGTRYVKVKLPPTLPSIPYSVKIDNTYYRVMHNGQKKICSLCMSEEHLFKDCPSFVCFRCKEQGHYARNCHSSKCVRCNEFEKQCTCNQVHVSSRVMALCDQCGRYDCVCFDSNDLDRCIDCDKSTCVCVSVDPSEIADEEILSDDGDINAKPSVDESSLQVNDDDCKTVECESIESHNEKVVHVDVHIDGSGMAPPGLDVSGDVQDTAPPSRINIQSDLQPVADEIDIDPNCESNFEREGPVSGHFWDKHESSVDSGDESMSVVSDLSGKEKDSQISQSNKISAVRRKKRKSKLSHVKNKSAYKKS